MKTKKAKNFKLLRVLEQQYTILYGFHIGKDTLENYVHIKFSNIKVRYIIITTRKEWRK